jgi:hypothetical protein
VLNHNFWSWCTVRVDFEKVDRAIISAGQYSANVYGAVARNGSFEKISAPDTHILIIF